MYSLFGTIGRGEACGYISEVINSSQTQKDRTESPVSLRALKREENNKGSDTVQHVRQVTTSGIKLNKDSAHTWAE